MPLPYRGQHKILTYTTIFSSVMQADRAEILGFLPGLRGYFRMLLTLSTNSAASVRLTVTVGVPSRVTRQAEEL